MNGLYVQYGCGNVAISGWQNFDASPTLRIQKLPFIGRLLQSKLNVVFDDEVLYGDIVRGLHIPAECVDGVFCSHVLEHLSLEDFHTALDNTFKILKRGGCSAASCLILSVIYANIIMQFLQILRNCKKTSIPQTKHQSRNAP